MDEPEQDKPHDLSIKSEPRATPTSGANPGAGPSGPSLSSTRKIKHIPPPLDLNAHTLEPEAVHAHGVHLGVNSPVAEARVPKSPNELPRESLPLRKRYVKDTSEMNENHRI